MPRPLRLVLWSLLIATTLVALSGCGSSGKSVARLEDASHSTISTATLNHWMQAMAGSDFRRRVATEGPTGLVSEPYDSSRCIDAAKLVAPRSFYNQLRLDRVQLAEKCGELYRSVKAQALSFLISSQWTLTEAAEHGITVSDADVKRTFARIRKQQYPTEQTLRTYLAERHWSLADLLYEVKLNTIVAKLLPSFQRRVVDAGGGERTYAKLALQHYDDIVAKTNCSNGYVVPGCSEYHGPPSVLPSPDVIIAQLTGKQPS
jgi:hypothetical protein